MPNDALPALLPVEDALAQILDGVTPLAPEQVSLSDALGRIAADDIRSRRTQPPTAVSSMDGYAVRTADIGDDGATLVRVGESPAGAAYEGTVEVGQTVRIFTGAPVPNGADAVIMQENADSEGEFDGAKITFKKSVAMGTAIREAGLDFKDGDIGIKAGRRLTARDIGFAAAMNVPWLPVHRKPKIAILATGDEIVRPGDPVGPYQIVSSNSFSLAAMVETCGGVPIDLGVAPDSEDGIRSLVAGAAGADVLVTTGGASVGEHDLIQKALGQDAIGEQGLKVGFWRIAMRPGKPLIFGSIAGVPMLGLPGNPVSTMICGLIFLRPLIAKLLGHDDLDIGQSAARIAVDLGANDLRQDYLRATLEARDGELWATPFRKQDSSMLSRLAMADCLIVREPHAPALKAGNRVKLLRFPSGMIGY